MPAKRCSGDLAVMRVVTGILLAAVDDDDAGVRVLLADLDLADLRSLAGCLAEHWTAAMCNVFGYERTRRALTTEALLLAVADDCGGAV